MQQALVTRRADATEIVEVPTIYPSGGEKQLIQILTGKEVPRGSWPSTSASCARTSAPAPRSRALEQDQPLISRIVTLTGDNVAETRQLGGAPGHADPHDLVELAGGYRRASRVTW